MHQEDFYGLVAVVSVEEEADQVVEVLRGERSTDRRNRSRGGSTEREKERKRHTGRDVEQVGRNRRVEERDTDQPQANSSIRHYQRRLHGWFT